MSAVGRQYRYVAAAGKMTGRYGETVTVVAWHGAKVLIQFADGHRALTVNHCLKKLPEPTLLEVTP